jgi:dihydrofolate reductase
VLLGRVTFEEMRSFWPLQTNDETGVAEYLNNVEKYVVSTTMKDPGGSAALCCPATSRIMCANLRTGKAKT